MTSRTFCTRVYALEASGKKVFPYTGVLGPKKGFYSVNFSFDNTGFEPMSEAELIAAIREGRFEPRGTIRMLPLRADTSRGNNAFAPLFLDGAPIPRNH